MSEEKKESLQPGGKSQEHREEDVPQKDYLHEATSETMEEVTDEDLIEKSADAIVDEIHAEIIAQSDDVHKQPAQADVDTSGYADLSLAQLATELRELMDKYDVTQIRSTVEQIHRLFERKYAEARQKALEQYKQTHDDESGFHFHLKEKDIFDTYYREFRRKLKDARKQYEEKLLENKAKREALIAELKKLLLEESVNLKTSELIKRFKQIQQQWRKIGNVPRRDYENLWNNFKHWEGEFYKLIELDREYRKKIYDENLKEKQKIIARARELLTEENVLKAFRELQYLHKVWKEQTGPVAPELREEIWQEFKTLTKQIHDRRRAYMARVKEERLKEWERKEGLVQQLAQIAEQEPKTHAEWQKLSKEVEAIHASFFSGYRAPKKLVDAFFEQIHKFNRKKNAYYKAFKAVLKENLSRKKALIEQVHALKESEDPKAAAERCKEIRQQWYEIGPVPKKISDKVWEEFNQACRDFYSFYRSRVQEEMSREYQNYLNKKEFLQKLKERFRNPDEPLDADIISEIRKQWKELGHVPNNVRFINNKFHRFLSSLYRRLGIDENEIKLIEYRQYLESIANERHILDRESRYLRDKIESLERDLINAENNLNNFFKFSDKNNPLLKEVERKIEQLREQLNFWRKKQKILNEIRNS